MGSNGFEHVGVVTTGKTTVAGDQNVTDLFDGTLDYVWRAEVGIATGNIDQSRIEGVEVATGVINAFTGFAQLGRCNQLHCFGDLHGAFNALNAVFNVLHIGSCHKKAPFRLNWLNFKFP